VRVSRNEYTTESEGALAMIRITWIIILLTVFFSQPLRAAGTQCDDKAPPSASAGCTHGDW
jgi:hypothetical protein